MPIPKEISPPTFKRRQGICPGHLLEEIHRLGVPDKPFYDVTSGFAHHKPTADWTIDGLGEFDCHDNVLPLMAHDDVVVDPEQLDFYPKTMNDWHGKDIGKKIKWLFLGDYEGAVEAKEKGEDAFVFTGE